MLINHFRQKSIKIRKKTLNFAENKFWSVGLYLRHIAGNSSAILNYSFIDDKPVACSFNYYRISHHDYNGVSEVFGPVILKFNPINKISVWPNPFDTKLALNFNEETGIDKLEVTNVKGEIVFLQTFLDKGLEIINTETWKSGTYFIAVSGPYFCKIFKFLKI